jgi:hypothetical protein
VQAFLPPPPTPPVCLWGNNNHRQTKKIDKVEGRKKKKIEIRRRRRCVYSYKFIYKIYTRHAYSNPLFPLLFSPSREQGTRRDGETETRPAPINVNLAQLQRETRCASGGSSSSTGRDVVRVPI